VTIDGNCEACGDHTLASLDGKTCESDPCTIREYTTIVGKCEECDNYLIGAGKECIAVTCGTRERVTRDGSCKACRDYTKASSDGRTCESDPCEIREYTTIEGTCATCDDYLIGAGKECIAVTCGSR